MIEKSPTLEKESSARNTLRPAPERKTRGQDHEVAIDLLAIIRRRIWLIIFSGFIGLAIGVGYFLYAPPKYESTAQILLMQNDSAILASQMANSGESISKDLLATHMSMLQSKRIVGQSLASSGLSELPSIQTELSENTTATDYVVDNLYITRGGQGAARDARTLSIAFRHNNPEDSQRVVKAILDEYRSFVESKFKDINQEAVKLINSARVEIEDQINTLAGSYRKFRDDSPLITSEAGGGNIHEMRYQELAAEISQLSITIDEAKERLDLVKSGLARLEKSDSHSLEKLALIDERNAERLGILVTVERGEAQTASFQALQPQRMAGATVEYSSLLEMKSRLNQVTQELGTNHPEVRKLQSQVADMEQFLNNRSNKLSVSDNEKVLTPDDVMHAYVNLLTNDLQVLEQRKKNLERQQTLAETEAKKLSNIELQNDDMIRQQSRLESLYDSVVTRLRDINMQQDATSLIQEVIQEPEVGERVSPSVPIAAAIILLCTFVCSTGLILLAEITDTKIRSVEQLEELLGASVIGQIPNFSKDYALKRLIAKITKSKPSVAPTILALHEPKSNVSEAIRGIRTQMLFSLQGDKKVMAITSSSQGEGKSTITANLAISVAKTGKATILIDCDLRRPSVHKLFGLNNKHGLVDVVGGTLHLNDVCQAGPCSHLSILTTGEIPSNPAELLSNSNFYLLIETLRQKYDYVIIDCPPLLAVSDPTIIAPLADILLLVSVPDNCNTRAVLHVKKLLTSVNCRPAGIIANFTETTKSNYGYYGYYASN